MKVINVVWPVCLLIVCALVLLTVWTATGDFGWDRIELDELTGESLGKCTGTRAIPFLIPILIILMIPMMLTCYMSYKTNDVDSMYSESKWIFALILVHMEVRSYPYLLLGTVFSQFCMTIDAR